MTGAAAAAARVAEHASDRAATLGPGRLICIDGPSGSGKTTLAERLVRVLPATVVHTDQLCPGWDGLAEVPAILSALLAPMAEGRNGRFQAWDWINGRPGSTVEIRSAPVLLVEGVGAGARSISDWTTTLVWLDAAAHQRKDRALRRDGDHFRDHWDDWARAEAGYFAAEQVRERADLSFRTA